ncbi:MAG: DUF4333 domain-containing protein [Solirubrobacterales bacterium]|nr:DUF4333 domain-containing protein [Solirubrobacterales bacterium]
MTRAARWLAVAAIVIAAVPATGCGETVIDKAKLDATVQKSLERSLGEKVSSVDCPSGLPVDPGSTFSCEATLGNGKKVTVSLKNRDEEADVSIVGVQDAN